MGEVSTPIATMNLPEARRSLLHQLKMLSDYRHRIDHVVVESLTDDTVKAMLHEWDVLVRNAEQTEERIEELEESEAESIELDGGER